MKTSTLTKGITFLSIASVLTISFAGCGEQAAREDAETKSEIVVEDLKDMGKKPWVVDIEEATVASDNYRKVIWSGEYMQLVLMALKPGETINLEVHNNHDQFIRVEQGTGRIQMGKSSDNLNFDEEIAHDWAALIPAGYWHKVTNTGNKDLKLYTLYAPPEHAKGTVHKTYEEAEEYGHDH